MLSVAGVCVDVVAFDHGVREPDEPAYAEFIVSEAGRRADVSVDLVTGSPLLPPGPAVFDTGQAWSLHREPGGYRLGFRSGPEGADHLELFCDEGFARITAFVDDIVPGVSVFSSPVRYPVDQLILLHHLAGRGGVIVHAAGVVIDGGAVALCGVSGAGKTTVARRYIAAGMADRLLSDDRLVLRIRDDGSCIVWGTPWPGDAGVARNAAAPLRALVFLAQEPSDVAGCEVAEIPPAEALRRLLPVISCPWYDEERMTSVLDTCGRIVERHACFELRFGLKGPVVATLDELAHALDP